MVVPTRSALEQAAVPPPSTRLRGPLSPPVAAHARGAAWLMREPLHLLAIHLSLLFALCPSLGPLKRWVASLAHLPARDWKLQLVLAGGVQSVSGLPFLAVPRAPGFSAAPARA